MHVYIPVKSNGVSRNEKVVASAAEMIKNPSVRTATVALRGAKQDYDKASSLYNSAVVEYNTAALRGKTRYLTMRAMAKLLMTKAQAMDNFAIQAGKWRDETIKVLDRAARTIQPWARARAHRLRFVAYMQNRNFARVAYEQRCQALRKKFYCVQPVTKRKSTEAPVPAVGPCRAKRQRTLQ